MDFVNQRAPARTPFVPLFICLTGLLASWSVLSPADRRVTTAPTTSVTAPEKLSADGLENLWALPLGEGHVLYSGGQPDGETGFRSLQSLGIRTVISVDGARPEVETAKKFGLRYVHLPIGYDRVPAERLQDMVRAARMLPQPIYLHCHHGKHRGPASAVCILRSLDAAITPERGVELLREMGTHPKYAGLYRSVEQGQPVTTAKTSGPAEFPEATAVSPLADQMVAIDLVWEQLQAAAKTSGNADESASRLKELWTDLAERFRESARLSDQTGLKSTSDLKDALAETARFMDAAEEVRPNLRLLESHCGACHAKFRD
jgi:hypothetical protein